MKYQLPLDSARSEIIFAPFHDPEHAPWLTVHVESTTGNKIVRDSLWDSTTFSWSEADRPARFTLKAFGSFAAGQYDELVLCLALPRAASLRIALLGRAGEILPRWSTPILGKGTRQELVLRIADLVPVLHKLKRLWSPAEYAGIALSVSTEATDVPILSLNWFGLRNSALFASIARQQKASRPDWEPWILPDEAWGPVKFTRGLLFDADALAGVRAKLENPKWRTHFSLLEDRARTYLLRDPEADFGEFLPNHDARYIREAQHGRTCYHWEALVLAFVGLVREDRAMIRHAVRYLMCMVHTRHWTESGEHVIPSSTWTHLCFAEEMTTTSVAILLDWLGFALFSRTHLLVRKALFEKGMAPVARVLASRESIHRMNQGAVFNRAMILGGLMLESDWPRFGTGTVDKAHQSMGEVLDHYVKADGGVHEGVGYLCQTMHATLWAMIAYGRARGTNWRDEVRRRFGFTSVLSAAELLLAEDLDRDRENFKMRTPCLTR
jgi:hypothetical protein